MQAFIRFFIVVSFFSCSVRQSVVKDETARERVSFNDNWRFSLTADSTAVAPEFQDNGWRKLSVPHDWSIEGKFAESNPAGAGGGALPGGLGWYRKTFQLTDADKGKRIFIEFDGVYCNSTAWLNGKLLGTRPNGYISFHYELTPHVNFSGDNVLVVKVDNSKQPNSRWYSGSGIYRNVWLTKTNAVYVDQWGTYVTTPEVSAAKATVQVSNTVRNSTASAKEVLVENILLDRNHNKVASNDTTITIAANSSATVLQKLQLVNPSLWSVEAPALYTVSTILRSEGKLSDSYETTTGIRSFEFDAHKGFFLNGKATKILGVCNHHDLGCLGAAINTRAIERQLEILKAMGVNAIRTSHNPPAPELLDLCDRMGFIVMDEMFDMWKKQKSTYDYSNYWDEWHVRDLEDFIRRDRNHPSVFMWSIGNEIGEQWDTTGIALTRKLAGIVRKLDPTRPITTGNNEAGTHNSLIKSGELDIIGYNYNHKDFAKFHERYPGMKFIATETTSALATRGHYDMPSDSIRRWPISWDKPFTQGNKDNTVSAYDNVSTPWGSTHEETWKIVKKYPHISGMFIWTGFDYLGEPTPYGWPSRSSYFGVIDLAGFPKDTYYMYQGEWTDTPVLHVFPHWNWKQGQVVDVWVYYSQADEVELYLNGTSQGVKKKQNDDLHVMWRVKYAPGTIVAVSRKDGNEVMHREVKTSGEAYQLMLQADRSEINADGSDLSFITVSVLDKEGNVVPTADNTIQFVIEGNASIAAVDNGDPTSHESFQSNSRNAFHGLALLVLKASTQKGDVKVKATSEGLKESDITIVLK